MILTMLAIAIAGAAPTAKAQPAEADPQRKVCRRHAETGSLVRQTKICRTKADWRRIEEGAQETGRGMQSLLSTERGN